MAAWNDDELVLDPSRITLSIGRTGYDGDTFKREQLMDRHGVQINKTSRNTVLFMTNIGTTRSSVAFLVDVLVNSPGELDEHISEIGLGERSRFEQRVRRLTARAAVQPDFSGLHPVFRDLDTPKIHGYQPDVGYRVYTEKAIEMCRPADALIGNGHRPLPAESPEPAPAPRSTLRLGG